MHNKSPKNDIASKNLNVVCDMELILGLPCLLPLFKCVHKLIKIVQGQDVFVCNLVEVVKLAQLELYKFYYHSFTKFKDVGFDDFNAIKNLTNATNVDAMVFLLEWQRGCKIPCIFFLRQITYL
jgi:hypothetical protein